MTDTQREKAYAAYQEIKLFPSDGGLSDAKVSHFLDLAQQIGDLPKDIPPQSAWLDTSFVKAYADSHKS